MSLTPNPLERIEESIRNAGAVDERDRERLLGFSETLRREQYGASTHRQLLRTCATLAGVSDGHGPDEFPEVAS